MKSNRLFQSGCNLAPDYGFFGSGIEKFGQFIQEVELTPLRVTGQGSDIDYEWHPEKPNAYGVYLRYTEFAQTKLNLNPSEWIADFSDRQTAEQFKSLVIRLLTAYMSEQEKEELAFKLMPEQDATASQVSANPIISDELRADLTGRWKDIRCLAYSFNRLNDGRAEQWQLFVTPTTDYLMLDDGGEIGEYIYFTEEDLRKDIAAMEELKESFTEI